MGGIKTPASDRWFWGFIAFQSAVLPIFQTAALVMHGPNSWWNALPPLLYWLLVIPCSVPWFREIDRLTEQEIVEWFKTKYPR